MDKNVAVIVPGADGQEIKDLAIKPGTTTTDVLRSLKLEKYAISKRDGKLLGPRDNVYDLVENGEKLYASTEAEVGK
jgi:hypothetical protein